MAGKNPKEPQHAKVCKPIGLRLRDCESHLRHLKEDLIAYANKDRDRYKTIAGYLRVLDCKFGRNKPLLLELMDHFGFVYPWQDQPPFDECLIPLLGGRSEPPPIPLRKYVDEVLAARVFGHEYSYARLTRQKVRIPSLCGRRPDDDRRPATDGGRRRVPAQEGAPIRF
jgi:hypothetical protein